MRRHLVQPVAALLLALHGLIAVSGNAGLHAISGCVHGDDAEFCSDNHESPWLGHYCCSPEAQYCFERSDEAGSCLADSHDCPICHWWYSCGQLILVTGSAMYVDLQLLTGVVGEIGILLPRPDHREGFPRGPPPVLCLA
jgi:hypothetical protein